MSGRLSRAWVVGMGEVGRRLATALAAAGVSVRPVTRLSGWEGVPSEAGAAVLVCVREEVLPDVVARLAGVASERLVFVQNGWVGPLLAGFAGCTRGLIWFTSKGDFFRVLRASVFAGPLAGELASALARGGIPAVAVERAAFAAAEAEKMGFNCVVGLPLAVHRMSLAEYLEREREEARAVFDEVLTVISRALSVAPPSGAWEEFVRACEPIGTLRPAAPKAVEYRNGAVVQLARALDVRAPVNQKLLAAAGYPA